MLFEVQVREWEELIPLEDRDLYLQAGFGNNTTDLNSPGLIIVDALWSFIGHERVEVSEAIKEYPTACGISGWNAVEKIAEALLFFREMNLPIVYVCADPSMRDHFGSTTRARSSVSPVDIEAFSIPDAISPINGEPIIYKTKASAFFRTPLDVMLQRANIKTVLLVGSTTSGCIRASCVDAYSLGFNTVLLEDGVWDRSNFSHSASLFDLSMKYASVIDVRTACERIKLAEPY